MMWHYVLIVVFQIQMSTTISGTNCAQEYIALMHKLYITLFHIGGSGYKFTHGYHLAPAHANVCQLFTICPLRFNFVST